MALNITNSTLLLKLIRALQLIVMKDFITKATLWIRSLRSTRHDFDYYQIRSQVFPMSSLTDQSVRELCVSQQKTNTIFHSLFQRKSTSSLTYQVHKFKTRSTLSYVGSPKITRNGKEFYSIVIKSEREYCVSQQQTNPI